MVGPATSFTTTVLPLVKMFVSPLVSLLTDVPLVDISLVDVPLVDVPHVSVTLLTVKTLYDQQV